MKITKENIEALGFNFKVKDDAADSDYTFNKPSNRIGWIDMLVWHPESNEVFLSQHTPELFEVTKRGIVYPNTNINDYIVKIFESSFNNMNELVAKLKENNII